MEEPRVLACPHCSAPTSVQDFFCPQCGKKIRDKPPSTSFWQQVFVYAIAVFLPPFGLWPAVHYLRQKDEKSRRIGIAAIIFTVVSLIATVWLTINAVNSINDTINSLTNLG